MIESKENNFPVKVSMFYKKMNQNDDYPK